MSVELPRQGRIRGALVKKVAQVLPVLFSPQDYDLT